jgi:hypothetical protein
MSIPVLHPTATALSVCGAQRFTVERLQIRSPIKTGMRLLRVMTW